MLTSHTEHKSIEILKVAQYHKSKVNTQNYISLFKKIYVVDEKIVDTFTGWLSNYNFYSQTPCTQLSAF